MQLVVQGGCIPALFSAFSFFQSVSLTAALLSDALSPSYPKKTATARMLWPFSK
ncbi:hypothetical protein PANA5342_0009 [Pantoea ananatis LMG 5342]|nr:hypothetical protein PANA5342_0009 [Pantoea ananatis LMG 5342]